MSSFEADRSQQVAATQALADTPMELWSYAPYVPAHAAEDLLPSPGTSSNQTVIQLDRGVLAIGEEVPI